MGLDRAVRMNFPVSKALSAAGQKDADRMVGADDTPPKLKEPFNELHCFDVRHGAQNRATKPFARGQWLAAARLRLQGLGDAHLQRDSRQLPGELDPPRPLPCPFDRRSDHARFRDPNVRYRGSHGGTLGVRDPAQHPTNR